MTNMRHLIDLVEGASKVAILYHTTSNFAACEIMTHHSVKPKSGDGFVSFSPKMMPHGDIEAHDVSLGFRAAAFSGQTEPVQYEWEWFVNNRSKASYIAGEGWSEQFSYEPDDSDYDEDGEYDDGNENQAYEDAEYTSFEDKHAEKEHISRVPGSAVTFQPSDVLVLIIHDRWSSDWRTWLDENGYQHVKVLEK